MAKGRKSKGGASKKKSDSSSLKEEKNPPKVSSATEEEKEESQVDDKGGEGNVNFIGVVPKSKKGDTVCSTDGCENNAVAKWAVSEASDDHFHACEECQLEKCGGWPDGTNPPNEENEDGDENSPKPESEPSNDEKNSVEEVNIASQSKATSPSNGSLPDNGKPCIDQDPKTPLEATAAAVLTQEGDSLTQSAATSPNLAADQDSNEAALDKTPTPHPSKTNETEVVAVAKLDEKGSGESEGDGTAEDDDDAEEDDDAWNLIKILSKDSLSDKAPIICDTDVCELRACVLYASERNAQDRWYGCLDCQDTEFGGWPELNEMPVKFLTRDHMQAMAKHCSNQTKPEMPEFDIPSSNTSALTPLSSQAGKGKAKGQSLVTPSPHPLSNKSAKEAKKPSKHAMALHQTWQKEAEEAGGADARIVVHKSAAKKRIFDYLHDSFKPQNITQVHKGLKCVVPKPVLSSCLDDMAALNKPFEMSDDDDDDDGDSRPKSGKTNKNASDDPLDGSILLKGGKLFHVDYTKTKNNGDPDPVELNELCGKLATATAEEMGLNDSLQKLTAQATKLLQEPTNEEAARRLSEESPALEDLRGKVEEARNLKVNEKHQKATKRKIESMAGEWRKRMRLCREFLINMEEMTDGTISMKKCLKGDGQIYIESDASVLAMARENAKNKRMKPAGRKLLMKSNKLGAATSKNGKTSATSTVADENFIGVELSAQGTVKREYLNE